MILLDLHVLQSGSEVGQRIGNPQQYKAAATQGTNAEHSQFMIYEIACQTYDAISKILTLLSRFLTYLALFK